MNEVGRFTLHFTCTVDPAATWSSTCNLWDPRHVNHHLRQGEIILPCSVIFSAQSISIYHSNSHSVYVYRQGLLTVSAGIHWRLTGTFSWHAIMPSISVFSILCASVLEYELCIITRQICKLNWDTYVHLLCTAEYTYSNESRSRVMKRWLCWNLRNIKMFCNWKLYSVGVWGV